MSRKVRPRIALALQGGGAYGAYGWGVIDRLLDEDLEIVAVSGASAGAVNGAALVAGLAADGPEGARRGLEALWRDVSRSSPLGAFQSFNVTGGAFAPLFDPLVDRMLEHAKLMTNLTAPWMPRSVRSMKALRDVVSRQVDLSRLGSEGAVPFYVSATDVRTGRARIFSDTEVTLDAIMASACLPELFDAVVIDDIPYWAGGSPATPPLDPLLRTHRRPTDMLLVQLTPFQSDSFGKTAVETMARINDISFSACLLRDLEALVRLQRSVRDGGVVDAELIDIASINLHLLSAAPELGDRGPAAKSDTRWRSIEELHDLGVRTADAWLEEHRSELGHETTLMIEEEPAAA